MQIFFLVSALIVSTTPTYAGLSNFEEVDLAFETADAVHREELPLPRTYKADCFYPDFFSPVLHRPSQSMTFFRQEAKHFIKIAESAQFYGSAEIDHTDGQMRGRYLASPLASLEVVLKRLVVKEEKTAYWLLQVPYLAYRNGYFYCVATDK